MSTVKAKPRARRGTQLLGAGALLFAGWAWAETGTLLKDSELRREPLGSAEVIAQLKAKALVEISARKGAWANVSADGSAGWLRLLNLRTGSGEKARSGFGALASTFATGSSGNAPSTGVKGLNAKTLSKASPNWDEFDKIDGFLAADADAKSFASQGKLQAQTLNYFPEEAPKGDRS